MNTQSPLSIPTLLSIKRGINEIRGGEFSKRLSTLVEKKLVSTPRRLLTVTSFEDFSSLSVFFKKVQFSTLEKLKRTDFDVAYSEME